MASGYQFKGTDLDDIFEAWRAGDPKAPPVDVAVNWDDLSNRYAPRSLGDRIPAPIDHSFQGTDYRDLFAAKRSVPRFLSPLPWDRTATINAAVYRQPSRPTLTCTIRLTITINRSGTVVIRRTYPAYNSNPEGSTYDDIYAVTDPSLWTDAGPIPNSPYQIRVDAVSGVIPYLGETHSNGVWITPNVTPYYVSMSVALVYTHSQLEGLKTAQSTFRIGVRRSEYPDTNVSTALMNVDLNLLVEPPALQNIGPNWNWGASNHADTNVSQPGGRVKTFQALCRLFIGTDGYYYQQAASTENSGSPPWTVLIAQRLYLRNGFNLADYEVMVTDPQGELTGSPVGVWLPINQNLQYIGKNDVGDENPAGTYNKEIQGTVTFREISTKNWAGLPDNTATTNFRMLCSVVIQPPIVSDWTGVGAWTGEILSSRTVVREPESLALVNIVRIYFFFYPSGVAEAVDNDGNVLQTSRWLPNGANANEYQLWVEYTGGSMFEGNQASGWTTVTSSNVTANIAVGYQHSTAEGTFEQLTQFNVRVRRIANPDDNIVNSATGITRIIVQPAVPLLTPVENYVTWANTYNVSRTVTVGPPPNQIVMPFQVPASRSYTANITRTVAAPTSVGYGGLIALRTTPDGYLLISGARVYYLTSEAGSGAQIAWLDQGTWYQLVSGNVSQYEFRMTNLSGHDVANNPWANWTTFGNPGGNVNPYIGPIVLLGINLTVTTETSTAPTRSGVFRIEVRHKTYPAHYASRDITLTANANLLAYNSGAPGGGGGGGGIDPPNPQPPIVEN